MFLAHGERVCEVSGQPWHVRVLVSDGDKEGSVKYSVVPHPKSGFRRRVET